MHTYKAKIDNFLKLTLSWMCIFYLTSCNKDFSEQIKKIKIGMTYEEVEKILDKPQQINRGLNKLIAETQDKYTTSLKDFQSRGDAQNILKNNTSVNSDFMLEYPDTVSLTIETLGTLLYVCWDYDQALWRVDTIVVRDIPKIVCDTVSYTPERTIYYWDNDGRPTRLSNEELYQAYKEQGFICWKEKIKSEPICRNYRIYKNTKTYVIKYRQAIIFDASSGRVTMVNYQPILCSLEY